MRPIETFNVSHLSPNLLAQIALGVIEEHLPKQLLTQKYGCHGLGLLSSFVPSELN